MPLPSAPVFAEIDAHQHFWRYSPEEYGWIDEPMASIRRDFLPTDLEANLTKAGLSGCIAVQARQSLEETSWLLELARQHPIIRGVVGWVPLAQDTVRADLERLTADPRLKGVRHVVQGEPPGFLDLPSFNTGIREVTTRGLTYDVLIFARQLDEAVRFVSRHPKQIFVVDHIAKPMISGRPDLAWRQGIEELAQREHVFCKFSGVVTEVPGWNWTPELLLPYFEVVLQAFGPRRLMFGSDWPVCLVATEYGRWVEFVRGCAAALSPDEKSLIFGGSAAAAYRL